MRALIFLAGASLFLVACGGQDSAGNTANASDDLAAEAIFANDTTAIDAATGDAATMAADVDYTVSSGGSGDVLADGSVDRRTVARRQNGEAEAADDADDSAAPAESAVETNDL